MTAAAARSETDSAVLALLDASLGMWGVAGAVELDGAGQFVVRTAGVELRVSRAPDVLPFRWITTCAGRERASGSVVGLLRHVRSVLDPTYSPARLRIAASPATEEP